MAKKNNIDVQQNLNALKAKLQNQASKLKTGEEINTKDDDLFWYGPPVSPKEFIESPEYFGNSFKQKVYPWVIDELENLYSGPYHSSKYATYVIMAGKGSGKSYFTSLANAYVWYWLLCFKNFSAFLKQKDGVMLDPNTTIQLIGMAKHARQAKEIDFPRWLGMVGDPREL
jgi:hypothetical protein